MPAKAKPDEKPPAKPWGKDNREFPQYVKDALYDNYFFLGKDVRQRMGLVLKVPIFIQDPQVGLGDARLCIQYIEVRLEACLSDGPTSARVAVVEANPEVDAQIPPVQWDAKSGWFRSPESGEWLPDQPGSRASSEESHRQFVESLVKNPYFHQVNVWAVAQRVLEFYQDPQALGRPIPWGLNGSRLTIIPHAGYAQNAHYDMESKSLKFYSYGDPENPCYTCLSHDIIAHETGHAVLDGIRPYYREAGSVETLAFHEYIGDLTAILLSLFNDDIRGYLAETTSGDFTGAEVLSDIAEQFGTMVDDRPYLRSAANPATMPSVAGSHDPHEVSQVLTGAMFEIMVAFAQERIRRGDAAAGEDAESEPGQPPARKDSPAEILWRTADAFRRTALQPLDLCPPCDIRFLDYTRAVLRNDMVTNPADDHGRREIMLEVFHKRGFCPCGHQRGQKLPAGSLPAGCLYRPALQPPQLRLRYHNIERIARSRTAAYYFLSDNRGALRIPAGADLSVVDVYDNAKAGSAAARLPREVVLEYLWHEAVPLTVPEQRCIKKKGLTLYCGGTLVFDDRGNLTSWFRKPGTGHLLPEQAQALRARRQAWIDDPDGAQQGGVKPLTRQEQAELEDYELGLSRITDLKKYHKAVADFRLSAGLDQPEG